MANLKHVLAAMRNGATLSLSFEKSPVWKLNDGSAAIRINVRVVRAAIKRGLIVGAGDTLLTDVASQTWHYREPKSP